MCSKQNGAFGAFFPLSPFLIASLRGPSWQAVLPVPMPACNVHCSPPVISYLCLRLHQPASSPATSQPTSTSLLLGQRLSRGYFFCFSHLLSFFLSLSFSHSFLLFLPSLCPSICLSASCLTSVSLPCSPPVRLSLPLSLGWRRTARSDAAAPSNYESIKKYTQSKVSFETCQETLRPCYRTHSQPAPALCTVRLYFFKGVILSLLVCHELKQLERIQKITFNHTDSRCIAVATDI